jgi:hypothetical protein
MNGTEHDAHVLDDVACALSTVHLMRFTYTGPYSVTVRALVRGTAGTETAAVIGRWEGVAPNDATRLAMMQHALVRCSML